MNKSSFAMLFDGNTQNPENMNKEDFKNFETFGYPEQLAMSLSNFRLFYNDITCIHWWDKAKLSNHCFHKLRNPDHPYWMVSRHVVAALINQRIRVKPFNLADWISDIILAARLDRSQATLRTTNSYARVPKDASDFLPNYYQWANYHHPNNVSEPAIVSSNTQLPW